jgi:hypothetical protein
LTAAGWQCYDHALRRLGPDTYLLTYLLGRFRGFDRRQHYHALTVGSHVPRHFTSKCSANPALYFRGALISAAPWWSIR